MTTHSQSRQTFIKKVRQTIERYQMLNSGDRVLIGVSGGPDSMALFHVLYELSHELSISFGIAHVNHMLRGMDADQDARFVSQLANTYQIPYFEKKIDIKAFSKKNKLSIEEAARTCRYAFLFQIQQNNGFNKIALGHHANDNAELMLMNLFRGSGLKGLCGIPPVRDGIIIRPLIRVSRIEILEFVSENRIEFVDDCSNNDIRFIRNKIRHQLIPKIQLEYNPNIVKTLTRISSIFEDEDQWIDQIITSVYRSVIISEDETSVLLCGSKLKDKHPAELRRIIRRSIQQIKGNLHKISFQQLDTVVQLIQSGKIGWSVDLPDQLRIRWDSNVLTVKKEQQPLRTSQITHELEHKPFRYIIENAGTIYINEAKLYLDIKILEKKNDLNFNSKQVVYFDGDIIGFPLVVRNYRPGDRFQPLGMVGSQKLSDFFINVKMPQPIRGGCPLLEYQDRIIWVIGYRTSEFGKIVSTTQKLIKIELFLA